MNNNPAPSGHENGTASVQRANRVWRTPTGLGVAATLMTVFLSFLGYGYALAVESMFGMPESLFAESPLDYLRLSSHVIGHLISAPVEQLKSSDFYLWLLTALWPACAVLSVLWIAFVYARTSGRLHRWIRCVQAKARDSAWLRVLRRVSAQFDAARKWTLLVSMGIWTLIPTALVLLVFAIAAFAVMLAFVPLLGFATGKAHLQKWVIEPTVCFPTQTQAERIRAAQREKDKSAHHNTNKQGSEIRGVACVMVEDGDKKNGTATRQGSVVVTTAKWIVLFDPASGAVWRLPVASAQVTVLSDLPSTKAVTALPPSDGSSP